MVPRLPARTAAADRTRHRLPDPPSPSRQRASGRAAARNRRRCHSGACLRQRRARHRRGHHPAPARRHNRRTATCRRPPTEGGEGPPPLPRGGMRMLATAYTLSATTRLQFDAAVERVRHELKAEGFGVLCEIDVRATLKQKLDVDSDPYTI